MVNNITHAVTHDRPKPRDIVIPSGRAMTNYVKIDELNLGGIGDSKGSAGKGLGAGLRGAIAAAALVACVVAGHFAPGLIGGALADAAPIVLYGASGGLGLVLAALLYFFLPKAAVEAAPEPAWEPPQAEDAESSISVGGFDPDESSIPEFDLEDTIPFHDGFQNQEPFKMTDVSELKAYLVVIAGPDKGRRFGLRPVSRIGRDLRLDIRPHDPEISRHHAVVTFDGRGFTAEDLGSTNGTFLNEDRIIGKRAIKHGDILRVGSSAMRFEFSSEVAAAR